MSRVMFMREGTCARDQNQNQHQDCVSTAFHQDCVSALGQQRPNPGHTGMSGHLRPRPALRAHRGAVRQRAAARQRLLGARRRQAPGAARRAAAATPAARRRHRPEALAGTPHPPPSPSLQRSAAAGAPPSPRRTGTAPPRDETRIARSVVQHCAWLFRMGFAVLLAGRSGWTPVPGRSAGSARRPRAAGPRSWHA